MVTNIVFFSFFKPKNCSFYFKSFSPVSNFYILRSSKKALSGPNTDYFHGIKYNMLRVEQESKISIIQIGWIWMFEIVFLSYHKIIVYKFLCIAYLVLHRSYSNLGFLKVSKYWPSKKHWALVTSKLVSYTGCPVGVGKWGPEILACGKQQQIREE